MSGKTSSMARRSVAGSRRSVVPAASTAAPPADVQAEGDTRVTPTSMKRNSTDSPHKNASKRYKTASEEAKRILAAYDPEAASSSSSPSSASSHIHRLLHAFATKQTRRTPRASSSLSEHEAAQSWNPVDVEWSIFQDWPQGLELEEKEMRQYYKYLKFIHLEHETKIRFITEIVDDLTADPPREAVVYTPRDVKEREAATAALKSQLKEAKSQVRSLRAAIDDLATRLAEPYRHLTTSCSEAKALLDECMDLELELVKIKSERGIPDESDGDVDVEKMDLETLPPVGTLTETEADRFCARQEEALAELEDANANLEEVMNRIRGDAKAANKAVNRLSSENSVAERQAREAQQLGVGGKKRDKEVERVCASHSATLSLLKALVGLRNVDAPSDTQLRLTYVSPADGTELELALHFDEPGGRVVRLELNHESQQQPISLPASDEREAARTTYARDFGTLLAAIEANDVPAIVMEAWDWVERKGRESNGTVA